MTTDIHPYIFFQWWKSYIENTFLLSFKCYNADENLVVKLKILLRFFHFSENATCTFFFGFCKRQNADFFHISFWWLGWQRVGGDWVDEGGPPPSPASIEVLFRWWPSRNTVVCRVRFHMSWASLNFKIQLF